MVTLEELHKSTAQGEESACLHLIIVLYNSGLHIQQLMKQNYNKHCHKPQRHNNLCSGLMRLGGAFSYLIL